MKTHVEFRSDRFPADEDERQLINEGCFGKRLAQFLASGLEEHGFQVATLIPEDWGWIVPIRNDGFPLWIGCGNYSEYPDGFLCFIEPHRPVIRPWLLWKLDVRDRVEELRIAMDKVLSESAGIRDKRWWTYDEFMSPV